MGSALTTDTAFGDTGVTGLAGALTKAISPVCQGGTVHLRAQGELSHQTKQISTSRRIILERKTAENSKCTGVYSDFERGVADFDPRAENSPLTRDFLLEVSASQH